MWQIFLHTVLNLINYYLSNGESIFYIIWYSDDPSYNLRRNSKYDSISCQKFAAFNFPWMGNFRVHNEKDWTSWTIKRRVHQILQWKVCFWTQTMHLICYKQILELRFYFKTRISLILLLAPNGSRTAHFTMSTKKVSRL